MSEEVKFKRTKGRIKVHSLSPYKGYKICVRQIDESIFEYLVTTGDIYSDYFIITPQQGKKKLLKNEVKEASAMIGIGAVNTIDALIELARLKEEEKTNIQSSPMEDKYPVEELNLPDSNKNN